MNRKSELGTALLAVVLALTPAAGQPPAGVDTVDNELIVLLRPGPEHPAAPAAVAAVNNGQTPLPGGLGHGSPFRAELVISEPNRARGAAREQLLAESSRSRARLERTIVLHYPSAAAIPGIMTALASAPSVEFVERNQPLRFHAAGAGVRPGRGQGPLKAQPQDPYFPRPSGPNPDPEAYQWGLHAMNFAGAWHILDANSTVALLDQGIKPGHPDLEVADDSGPVPVFLGGNFRASMSFDYIGDDCDVDEKKDPLTLHVSHGTMVSGLVGATSNDLGVVGGCRHCPLVMAKIWNQREQAGLNDAADAIIDMVDKGTELISMSFGSIGDCDSPSGEPNLNFFCAALAFANEREVIMVASVGNDRTAVEFPAVDPRVIAAGGISPDGSLWDEWPNCFRGPDDHFECGSNFGPEMELVAPAKSVLSTAYHNANQNVDLRCGDSFGSVGTASDGFGVCTGTSMASPKITAAAAHPKTGNRLLGQAQIRESLKQTASLRGAFDPRLAFGIPNAAAATREAMGYVDGVPLRNRLTPFFVLYYSPGPDRASSLFTSSPQRAAAAAIGIDGFPFDTVGPVVPGYPAFPGVSPPQPNQIPRAYVFLFTTPHAPAGQSFDLVPIYRLSKDPGRQAECTGTPDPDAEWSFAYARDADEIIALRAEGYSLRGIEGYLVDPSGPLPVGAVELHRLFNADLQDWVVVPESKIANLPPGYAPRPAFPEIVWAGIDNVDSDGDGVVDGFETILRTNPAVADSDGDGVNDGDEVLGYTGAVPPGGVILGDPLCPITRCHLFLDGFESGGTGQWSSVTP